MLTAKKLTATYSLDLSEEEPPRPGARELYAWVVEWVRYLLGRQRCRCGKGHRPRWPWAPTPEQEAISAMSDAIAREVDAGIERELILAASWRSVAEYGLPPYVEGEQWWVYGPTFPGKVFVAERTESDLWGWTNGDTWSDFDRGVTHYQRAEVPPPPEEPEDDGSDAR